MYGRDSSRHRQHGTTDASALELARDADLPDWIVLLHGNLSSLRAVRHFSKLIGYGFCVINVEATRELL